VHALSPNVVSYFWLSQSPE
jgi:DHA2 family multidrug resistance protein